MLYVVARVTYLLIQAFKIKALLARNQKWTWEGVSPYLVEWYYYCCKLYVTLLLHTVLAVLNSWTSNSWIVEEDIELWGRSTHAVHWVPTCCALTVILKALVAMTMAIRMAMRVAIRVIRTGQKPVIWCDMMSIDASNLAQFRITYSRIWVATMMPMSNRIWAWQAQWSQIFVTWTCMPYKVYLTLF